MFSSMFVAALMALLQSSYLVPPGALSSWQLTPPVVPSLPRPRSASHIELAAGLASFYSLDVLHEHGPNLWGGGADIVLYYDHPSHVGFWVSTEFGAANAHMTWPTFEGTSVGYACPAAGAHLHYGGLRILLGPRSCSYWSIGSKPLMEEGAELFPRVSVEGILAVEYTVAHRIAFEAQLAAGGDLFGRRGLGGERHEWAFAVTPAVAILFSFDLSRSSSSR